MNIVHKILKEAQRVGEIIKWLKKIKTSTQFIQS